MTEKSKFQQLKYYIGAVHLDQTRISMRPQDIHIIYSMAYQFYGHGFSEDEAVASFVIRNGVNTL